MGHDHKYMGHETANWGGRGLGYMLFNVHLCNQPYYYQVVVEPGAQLCTLLEVRVLRLLDWSTLILSDNKTHNTLERWNLTEDQDNPWCRYLRSGRVSARSERDVECQCRCSHTRSTSEVAHVFGTP
jgi:hypothetical protein